ncbi:MAG: hypothetical protein COU40_03240 [Candidatus Moranbacteria bacterium CG10_big_fil_rev_8_21_14_0_10_35_21]|nr:MAG: hypothetical protein COU40_03240 [Candidatus Moranbacteria bacterium CG10_big_fil_rev_8_21_14_0_10_35_21]PJA88512.1 MAG: hypothetical protein CO139_02605 [Candidatus Moranbacteria bacterium CG_4_9_14_3_um_filter_36_9]
METLLKADIFFFISSISSVILTILFCIVLLYFIKAGKNLYKISEKLQSHFEDSEEFVLDLKEKLEENMLFRMFFPPARKRKRNAKKDSESK